MTPRWVDVNVVLAIHEQQIAEHGGLLGVRDWGVIESALQRPPEPASVWNVGYI